MAAQRRRQGGPGDPPQDLAINGAETRAADLDPVDRETALYRTLAGRAGIPFSDDPITIHPDVRIPAAFAAGIAPLDPRHAPFRLALAPHGAGRDLLSRHDLSGRQDLLMVTPKQFRAGVREAGKTAIAHEAAWGLAQSRPHLSARSTITRPQAAWALAGLAIISLLLWLSPTSGLVVLGLLASPLFLGLIVLRMGASFEALAVQDLPDLPDLVAWPVYTVIVPLHDEAVMVPRLIEALAQLDYPCDRLDIKIVIEADDAGTRAALERLENDGRLPRHMEIVTAPTGLPRTKPRALNVALMEARGSLLTIYDAEDRPAPDQLKRAARLFGRLPRRVACLQARLTIDNVDDSIVSRLFALEYAALFDVINPGTVASRLPPLLGGTSNHFRTATLRDIGGWDPWNVTEDADLSFRLTRAGKLIFDLPSDTREEAPVRLGQWFQQRRRWMKGFMQTALTHGRDPRLLVHEAGALNAVALMSMCLGTVISALLYPFFLLLLVMQALTGRIFAIDTPLAAAGTTLALVLMVLGLIAMILPAVLGARRRGLLDIVWLCPLLPAWFVMVSAAAWMGMADLVRRPSHWHKTRHGLATTSRAARPGQTGRGGPALRREPGLTPARS